MANRLTKLAVVTYTAGRPYIPARPAYCVDSSYTIPGYQEIIYGTGTEGSDSYNPEYSYYRYGKYVPPQVVTRRICYPATPAQAAINPQTSYTAITGWNGGARSVNQIHEDGYFQFQVKAAPQLLVVGLTTLDENNLPSEADHGLYFNGTLVQVIELGEVVHTAPVAHAQSNQYRITRVGPVVTYSGPGWSYMSGVPSSGSKFLDAAIYSTGDFVDNPSLTLTQATALVTGSLQPLDGHAYEGAYSEIYGSLQPLAGDGGAVPYTAAVGSFKALTGIAYEGDYTYVSGSLLPLTGVANGGFPAASYEYAIGTVAPLAGAAHSNTGEAATIEGAFPALYGISSDYPYAELRGSMAPLIGYADSGWPIPNEEYAQNPFLVGDFFSVVDMQSAAISDGLEITDTIDGVIEISDAIFDNLLLGDMVSVEQAVEAMIDAGLLLGNDLTSVRGTDIDGGLLPNYQPVQYAVNVLTSALTTYVNFDFASFTNVGQQLYGSKRDGVYLVRPGDDDGEPISGVIDFGTMTFNSTKIKSVSMVYLGVDTDGQLYVRMQTSTTDKLYRVVQRGDIMRAVPSKGIGSRQWNVSLEFVDATQFELDTLELLPGISSGRWSSR